MRIHNKLTGTRGIIKAWEESLKSPDELHRARVLAFWKKHGFSATQEAFRVSRRTLFRWQSLANRRMLAPKSKAPKNRRRRQTPTAVSEFLITQRKLHRRIGKEKLQPLLRERGYQYSVSTVGRILADLKRQGRLSSGQRLTLDARTGRLREYRKPRVKKLRRPKGYRVLEADTVVRFIDGVKRYVLTGIDTETRTAFAAAYTNHGSASAADFLAKTRAVLPDCPLDVQTDNGSEFAFHFHAAVTKLGLHFHTHPRSPKENAHVERFNRTLSEDFLESHKYLLRDDVAEFNRKLMEWLLWYNSERPHAALGQIPPLRYIYNQLQLPARECHMWWTRTFILRGINLIL